MKLIVVASILLSLVGFNYAGISIRCYFHTFTYPDPMGDTYTCDNAAVTLSEDGSRDVTTIVGAHETGKNYLDVHGIRIANQSQVTFMPRKLETKFPNLKAIQISNTNLEQISPSDLRPFPELEFFKAYGGNLTSVNGHLFRHNPKLRYISFNTNPIEHVGYDLVTYLENLANLYFSGNSCINMYSETREGVLQINNLLPEKCKPEECSGNCAFTIDELTAENDELWAEVRDLKQTLQITNEQHENAVNYYTQTIKMLRNELKNLR